MPQFKIPFAKREFARDQRVAPTAGERAFWQAARRKQINGLKFRRQVPVGPYIADFCCFEARLIVEIDGVIHARAGQHTKDAGRDAFLRAQGFEVLRFTDEAVVGNAAAVVDEVVCFIARRESC